MRDFQNQIILKSKEEIALMRKAGSIVSEVLYELKKKADVGVTTLELNKIAEEIILSYKNAVPTFKNYPNPYRCGRRFPASICTSINNEVIHGIPSKRRLSKGDILKIDCGVTYIGYIGDAAITFAIGEVSEEIKHLLEATEKALYKGIEAAKLNGRLHDISFAIQKYAESNGFSVVKEFCGHGVGILVHEYPPVPNFGTPGSGPKLREGMTIALEPMVNMGSSEVKIDKDGWTVVTADGKLSAHFEHTIAITNEGVKILTLP